MLLNLRSTMQALDFRRNWVILPLLMVSAVCAAQDRTCRDIAFPLHTQVSGSDLTLNGLGVRKATFLKVNVYVAALYVARPSRDATPLIDSDTPQQLILQFVRNVGVEDLRKAFVEGFERVAAQQSAGLKARIEKLNGWMEDMKSGQRLIFTRVPRTGVRVSVNGVDKGTLEGEDFSRALISIWLGATPPNPELKSGLLGGECG
jgi:hypothetical protein